MALVTSTVKQEDAIDGVQLLYQSARFFDEALKQFRLCHDLCLANSTIIDKPAASSMDQCAVKFRQNATYCTTLSEKVASVWCGTCITFYRNLEKIQDKNPSRLLSKISNNGKELAQGFRHLSECAQKLSMKFTTLNVGGTNIMSVQDKYVQAFKEEQRKIEVMQMKSQKELQDAKKQMTDAVMELEHREQQQFSVGKFKPFFFPIRRGLQLATGYEEYGIAIAEAEFSMTSAKEREAALAEELELLEKKLSKQTSETEKAEVNLYSNIIILTIIFLIACSFSNYQAYENATCCSSNM